MDNKKIDINIDELIKLDKPSLFAKIFELSRKMKLSDFFNFIKELYKKIPENDKRKRMIEELSKKLGINDLLYRLKVKL